MTPCRCSLVGCRTPRPRQRALERQATAGKPYYGGDILTHGINTTRGRAAEAIRDLILIDAGYIARFRTTLDRLVSDKSISVRSCVASTLRAVARHDPPLALELFTKLDAADDRLLATPYADRFIYDGLRQHFAQLRPYVERILRSKELKVSEAGARLASLAALYHEDAADLAKEAMSGNASQRLGVAQVASSTSPTLSAGRGAKNVCRHSSTMTIAKSAAAAASQSEPLES